MAFFVFLLCVGFLMLRSRILVLEERLKRLESTRTQHIDMKDAQPVVQEAVSAPVKSVSVPLPVEVPTVPFVDPDDRVYGTPVPSPVEATPPVYETRAPLPPEEPNAVFLWLSENTLIKVGAFLFFLGAAWFVSYAITKGWIPPTIRILLGILGGIGICVVGAWRKKSNVEHYLTLTTLGVGVIITSIYAGQFMFSVFSPLVALLLLLFTIGYAVFVSIRTNREWLAVLSAITALIAPFLVNVSDLNPTLFLFYLSGVTAIFLSLTFLINWRVVRLVLAFGAQLFLWLTYADGDILTGALWFFVLVFTLFFYFSSTAGVYKDEREMSPDITVLGMTALAFVFWSHELVVHDGLTVFIGALVTAITGYVLHSGKQSPTLVTVYTVLTTTLVLVATALTFDGYALSMVYTAEIGSILVMSMYLRLPFKVTYAGALLFTIPSVLALSEITATEWGSGIWHGPGVSLYAIVFASLIISLIGIQTGRVLRESRYESIGGAFLIVFWVYACISLSLICNSLLNGQEAVVTFYVSSTIISLLVLAYITSLRLPDGWRILSVTSFLLPLLVSFSSFDVGEWRFSVYHPDAVGLYFMTATALVLAITHLMRFREAGVALEASFSTVFVTVFWGYALAVTNLFFDALFPSSQVADVALYVTWACMAYGALQLVFKIESPRFWLTLPHLVLVLAVLLSTQSFLASEWKDSWMHVDALGLYVMTTLLVLISLGYERGKILYGNFAETLESCAYCILGTAFFFACALVWLISHAVFQSSDVAVSVALFVYTICGLVFYTLGRSNGSTTVRLAGAVLLGGVVLRLLLVDVWNMEVIGRVITFLGVGLLFIVTALFVKPFNLKGNDTSQ